MLFPLPGCFAHGCPHATLLSSFGPTLRCHLIRQPSATCSRPPSFPSSSLALVAALVIDSLVICLFGLHLLEGKLPKDKRFVGFMLAESWAGVVLSKQVLTK